MEHGSFVFRNEGDGCLTSKYMFDQKGPFTEACKRSGSLVGPDGFTGDYYCVWTEDPGVSGEADLVISKQTNPALFDLVWYALGTKSKKFEGVGMLYDGLLVGTYWQS